MSKSTNIDLLTEESVVLRLGSLRDLGIRNIRNRFTARSEAEEEIRHRKGDTRFDAIFFPFRR